MQATIKFSELEAFCARYRVYCMTVLHNGYRLVYDEKEFGSVTENKDVVRRASKLEMHDWKDLNGGLGLTNTAPNAGENLAAPINFADSKESHPARSTSAKSVDAGISGNEQGNLGGVVEIIRHDGRESKDLPVNAGTSSQPPAPIKPSQDDVAAYNGGLFFLREEQSSSPVMVNCAACSAPIEQGASCSICQAFERTRVDARHNRREYAIKKDLERNYREPYKDL